MISFSFTHETPPAISEQEIDGLALSVMSVSEVISLGASLGTAHEFMHSRSNYFASRSDPPPGGVNVSLDVSLLRIGEVWRTQL